MPRRSQPSRIMISAILANERRSASAARSSTVRTLGSTRKLRMAVFIFGLGMFALSAFVSIGVAFIRQNPYWDKGHSNREGCRG
jgi:hypothetical protein